MTDNLVVVCLIFIFCNKICRAGKCDLVNIFVNLFLRHAKAIIPDGNGLFIGVYADLDLILHILRLFVLAHQLQLFKLGDRVAAIADQLAVKDIVIGIKPLLITGKMFSLVIDKLPFFAIICASFLLIFLF